MDEMQELKKRFYPIPAEQVKKFPGQKKK